jgi:hypothetical protein
MFFFFDKLNNCVTSDSFKHKPIPDYLMYHWTEANLREIGGEYCCNEGLIQALFMCGVMPRLLSLSM